jgi:DNA-binding NtrC family response regulator
MNKILVVDDDSGLRENLVELLQGAEFLPEEAASGREAVEKTATETYNLALVDLMMPGMDGIDTLVELKRANPRMKVIMMTAFSTVENAVTAIKKGASDYITKPFRFDDLLVIIKRVLEEASFEDNIKKLDIGDTLSSLSNHIRRQIIQLLGSAGRMRFMEITRELKIEDHTKIVFHLRMLRDAGIIDQDEKKSYILTREGEKAIECLKILEHYLSNQNK